MTDAEVFQLIREIENAGPNQLSGDGSFFERVEHGRDIRVVRASVLLHHSLTNKKALSAHFLRLAIARNDGPDLRSLWSFIDAENDSAAIVERMDDYSYLPWAATFIIGEVGGASAFAATTTRLASPHQPRFHLLVRLLSHIVVRYLQIGRPEEPTGTIMDISTGERRKVSLRDFDARAYQNELTKRAQADAHFTPLNASIVTDAKRRLQPIPDSLLNIPRAEFLHALDCLQTRNA
ncbi:MAG: hypothetical protein HY300_15965 [Verrucomicrobia bacterium]|nr:hypothetical protein [Verrucomicrobiota bacterium]